MGTPLKIIILKSGFLYAREDQKICTEANVHKLGLQMANIRVDNREGVNFEHWAIWDPLPP